MAIGEDTEGEFIAREKEEAKNRILEGVKKNKGNSKATQGKSVKSPAKQVYSPGRKGTFSEQRRGQQYEILARVSRGESND